MINLPSLFALGPLWVWFGLAGLLVSLTLALGRSWPLALALGAGAVGAIDLAGLRAGPAIEFAVALAVSGSAFFVAGLLRRDAPGAEPAPEPALVGRIGRTAGAFANGVGRVWLDGSEWSAELARGEEAAPPDAAVQVVKVIGGAKLQVRTLSAAE